MSSSLDTSTVIFWAVLGGLILLCAIGMILVYYFCFSKNPRGCFQQNPIDELLGSGTTSPVSQTARSDVTRSDNSATDGKATSSQNTPRTGNAQTDHVIIRVSPHDNMADEVRDRDKLVQQQAIISRFRTHVVDSSPNGSNSPRQSQLTSIGCLDT